MRTYAWGSIISNGLLGVTEFIVICRPPSWVFDLSLIFLVFLGLLFPVIPFLLVRKILKRYKLVLGDIDFFSEKGKLESVKRYSPFGLSYVVFWLTFLLAMGA